jgi:hypothetical protein
MAPDGTYVGGEPDLASDVSYVGVSLYSPLMEPMWAMTKTNKFGECRN